MLITGASSGIGLALAKLGLQRGYRVVATARKSSLSRFRSLGLPESENFLIRPLDVTNADQREALIAELNKHHHGVDVLINNAGIAYRSVIEHMSSADELLQMETNFLGPMALTRLVLPRMRKQRRGCIVNISSVGGMMAMPTMGSYSASKFALEGASEALWYELRPWNVRVVLVQPGFVHSNAFRHIYWTHRGKSALTGQDDYHAYYSNMESFVERLMGIAHATPDSIAEKVLRTIESAHAPLRVSATADAVFFSWIRRFLPRRLYHGLLYRGLPGISHWGKN